MRTKQKRRERYLSTRREREREREREKRGGDPKNQRRLTPTGIVCSNENRITDEKTNEEKKTNEEPSASNCFCAKKKSETSIKIGYQ